MKLRFIKFGNCVVTSEYVCAHVRHTTTQFMSGRCDNEVDADPCSTNFFILWPNEFRSFTHTGEIIQRDRQ